MSTFPLSKLNFADICSSYTQRISLISSESSRSFVLFTKVTVVKVVSLKREGGGEVSTVCDP